MVKNVLLQALLSAANILTCFLLVMTNKSNVGTLNRIRLEPLCNPNVQCSVLLTLLVKDILLLFRPSGLIMVI